MKRPNHAVVQSSEFMYGGMICHIRPGILGNENIPIIVGRMDLKNNKSGTDPFYFFRRDSYYEKVMNLKRIDLGIPDSHCVEGLHGRIQQTIYREKNLTVYCYSWMPLF